jgi:hypothetical protein
MVLEIKRINTVAFDFLGRKVWRRKKGGLLRVDRRFQALAQGTV